MKIVINRDYGGFGLSIEATREYLSRKYGDDNWGESEPDKYGFIHFNVNGDYFHDSEIDRNDPVLVEIVERMGQDSDGKYSYLRVVEIPDDVEWYIEEYDGMEHVAEQHRTWC